MDLSFKALQPDYCRLWLQMEPIPRFAGEVDQVAHYIIAHRQRFEAVEQATACPWYVVGIIQHMESNPGGDPFACHLHNGDTLAARTRQVPRGRLPYPAQPPFTWEASAIDAIKIDALDKVGVGNWSIERVAYQLEIYNGMGYRSHPSWGIETPYLWSYSNLYTRGKYGADGVYSPRLVSDQPGAMVILRRLMQLDGAIAPQLEGTTAPATADEGLWAPTVIPAAARTATEATPEHGFPVAETKWTPAVSYALTSQRGWAYLFGILATVAQFFRDAVSHAIDAVTSLFDVFPDLTSQTKQTLDAGELVAGWLQLNWQEMAGGIAIACLVFGLVRHVMVERKRPPVNLNPESAT